MPHDLPFGLHLSVQEFHLMVAGSLIRNLVDEKESGTRNRTFIDDAASIELAFNRQPCSLYNLLKKLQVLRGKIAHVDADAPGIQSVSEILMDKASYFNDYAALCIGPLEELIAQYTNAVRAEMHFTVHPTGPESWVERLMRNESERDGRALA